MVLPNASRNRKAPKKCHSHTLAYLSISYSRAFGCSGALKFYVIQTKLTPDVFLKYFVNIKLELTPDVT